MKYSFLILTLALGMGVWPGGMNRMATAQESADASGKTTDEEANSDVSGKLDAGLLSGMKLRSIGPALMSGRIGDLAINPAQPNTWYAAAASGNLWKTVNSGNTWEPIFDKYGSYSIGCVTLDPQNPEIVWVGTGENVGGRHIGFGDGVYRSPNGGKSFENLGLKNSEHISKIVVDPRDSNVVFVASQGPLWSAGGERGLYRSEDAGQTWELVLSAGTWTGCTDVVIDHENPDVLYAALHQRHRTVAALLNTGPESGIHKSVDGGRTWRKLEQGLPSEDKGKISLAVSPQKNNVVYATIELPNRKGGFWRSEDCGESWSRASDFVAGGTGPHYYQEIWVDPHRFDCIYHANNVLVRSVDGGKTFESIEGRYKHVDNHAVVFHPTDPDFVLVGTDGGIYVSRDFSGTWTHFENLPLTQFYKVDVDYDLPFYHVIGGTQDNSTQYGPARTRLDTGIRNSEWIIPVGGDGHDNAINPDNPDIIFGESQQGFIRRYDRRTGQSISVQPQPAAGEPAFRFNWDSPILISPHNSSRVYFASNHLHRSDDHGDTWTTISPDLSRNENRLAMPMMGRVHGVDGGYDLDAMSQYGNITSISESPLVEGLVYAGTDDGMVQVTEDGGMNWRKIDRFFDVPDHAFVNDIKADRHDSDTVYVCMDDHKSGDFKPYLLRSKDRGKTWESMVGDLPDRHLVWRLEQDHVAPNLFFLGTEFGVFVSLDAGTKWIKLSGGMPNIPVRDLAIQKRENDLVCATFGRSFYVLDDYSPLRDVSTALDSKAEGKLFSPRKTPWFVESGVFPRDFLGDNFYTCANPDFGTLMTVWIRESAKTAKERRQKAEKEAAKEGRDVAIPTWEELQAESVEGPVKYVVEIRSTDNQPVARVDCPANAGLHRVNWNLRYSAPSTGSPGALVAPGQYSAQLHRVADNVFTAIGEPVGFSVEPIFDPAITAVARDEAIRFQQELSVLMAEVNRMNGDFARLQSEIEGSRTLIAGSAADPTALLEQVSALEAKARDLKKFFEGDAEKQSRTVIDVPTAQQRLGSVLYDIAGSTHGPTGTHRQQVEIAKPEIVSAITELNVFQQEVLTLRTAMEAQGLIWVEAAPRREQRD